MLDILLNLVECSYTTLPMTGGRKCSGTSVKGASGGLPGWQEEVEPFRQQSMYWHNVWLREGRPSQGWLHKTTVLKRTQYHYAVRKLKRKADLVRAEQLFEASLLGDMDLLKEMKKVKSGRGDHVDLPDVVEGANGEEEIVERFREVYETLYNSSGSQDGMAQLREHIQSLIGPQSLEDVQKLTGSVVKKAAFLLKPKKTYVS